MLEKASAIGAQLISGCALEPGPLDALLPGWRETPPDICVPATRDEFWYLTKTGGLRLPTPPQMHNRGNLIISLGQLAPLLAARAEALGVDVFPGFAASEALVEGDRVVGRTHRRHGTRPRAQARAQLRAGRRHPRGHDDPRRGLPRERQQAAHRAPRPRRRSGAADLRTRHQGALAASARSRGARAHPAHRRLAGRPEDLRRQLPLSPRPRPRVRRLCRGSRLPGPALQALRGIPAVQAPSAHPAPAGGRRNPGIRRTRDCRRRLAIAAAHGSAGAAPGRRRGGHAERAEDQGRAPGDPLRRARSRASGRDRRDRGLRGALARVGRRTGTQARAQHQAGFPPRPVVRACERGLGDRDRWPVAVDALPHAKTTSPCSVSRQRRSSTAAG